MPDTERMHRTLRHIRANRSLWMQGTWAVETACGTAYCYAGWTVVLEGIPVRIHESLGVGYVHIGDIPDPWLGRLLERHPGYLDADAESSAIVAISDLAATILDLSGPGRSRSEHWLLFGACNTLSDLEQAIHHIGATPTAEPAAA